MTTDIEHRVTFTCPCRRELRVDGPGADAACDCGETFSVTSSVTQRGEAIVEEPEAPAEEAPNPATPYAPLPTYTA